MPKKITDAQILGELGVSLIKTRLLQMGFTWHPTNAPLEAGIDGWIELRDQATGIVANCWLPVQSRARSVLERESDDSVSYTCNLTDLEYWMTGNAPVILVVSKPHSDEAWWVSIKDYFRNKDFRRDRRITFDRKQSRFDGDAAEQLKALGQQAGSGAYFTPVRKQELLVSNLLQVNRWATTIYYAETAIRDPEELRNALKEFIEWPPREWFLKDGRIYSFHNLADPPWCQVCDSSTITDVSSDEWAFSSSHDSQRMFVRLLNQCLREIVGRWSMGYSSEVDCYQFKPTKDLRARKISYKSQKRRTSRLVFRAYLSKTMTDCIAYYRHDGFSHQFRRYGGKWFLEISPTYVFTTDGKIPDPYREERLAKIKSIEGDAAVAGRVLMFADILRDRRTLFHEPYAMLTFGDLETAISDVSINDEAWSSIGGNEVQSDAVPDEPAAHKIRQGALFS